ncbi:MAG: hypothetical protein IJG63_01505 [Oscillospiraceae bacterium]|nr:hypothetical protein [Oscillospiraceae bacterium]
MVIISLLFIGAYYFLYFKASDLIRDIVLNAEAYGESIRGAAYGLYLFGRIGEGDWLATAVFAAVTALLFALVWTGLSRSFINIATDSGNTKKLRYVEKPLRERSVFGALLGKEFARFSSSANYMLNCGLGVLLLPAMGVLLLFAGRDIVDTIGSVFSGRPDCAAVLLCAMLCLISSMNDMAAPAVSLEGKSLWIPQSMPLEPRTALRSKAAVQIILTALPMLFAVICSAVIVKGSVGLRLLLCAMPLVYSVFSALCAVAVGLRMPLLNWTSELAPIKQSGAVTLALFGSWGVSVFFAGIYMLVGYKLGAAAYLGICTVLFAAAALAVLRWLDRKGAERFAAL